MKQNSDLFNFALDLSLAQLQSAGISTTRQMQNPERALAAIQEAKDVLKNVGMDGDYGIS